MDTNNYYFKNIENRSQWCEIVREDSHGKNVVFDYFVFLLRFVIADADIVLIIVQFSPLIQALFCFLHMLFFLQIQHDYKQYIECRIRTERVPDINIFQRL